MDEFPMKLVPKHSTEIKCIALIFLGDKQWSDFLWVNILIYILHFCLGINAILFRI